MGRQYGGVSAEERAAQRRLKLLAAAKELVGDEGHRAATLRAVCGRAGLTQRYFYEAFDSSEGMLRDLYHQQLDLLETTLSEAASRGGTGMEKVDEAVAAYFALLESDPRLARIILVEIIGVSAELDQVYRRGSRRFVDWVVALARQAIGEPEGLDLEIVATGAIGAVTLIATSWVLTGYRQPIDTVVTNASFTMRAIAGGVLSRAL